MFNNPFLLIVIILLIIIIGLLIYKNIYTAKIKSNIYYSGSLDGLDRKWSRCIEDPKDLQELEKNSIPNNRIQRIKRGSVLNDNLMFYNRSKTCQGSVERIQASPKIIYDYRYGGKDIAFTIDKLSNDKINT